MIKLMYDKLVSILDRNHSKRLFKKQVVYFMSFGGNNYFIEKLANQIGPNNLIVCYQKNCKNEINDLINRGLINQAKVFSIYDLNNIIKWIRGGKVVIFDNYYPFLASIRKQRGQKFYQIWHANGAIKKFGWLDPSNNHRTIRDKKRFQKVYDSFDHVVVGSKKMGEIFKNNWHLSDNQIDLIGYPRTDQLLDQNWIKKTRSKVFDDLPNLKHKKIILYTPTYRKGVKYNLSSDWNKLDIPLNSMFIIKLHPHLREVEKKLVEDQKKSNVIILDHNFSTQDLLTITDVLITDYSSTVFDFSLLSNSKQILFWLYDQVDFESTVGIQSNFYKEIKSTPVSTAEELNEILLSKDDNFEISQNVNEIWNTYNDGKAGDRLISKIEQELKYEV